MFASCDVYLQIFENRIRGVNVSSGGIVDLTATPPFSHPRTLVGEFPAAAVAAKEVVTRLNALSFWKRLRIVIQPMEHCESGMTDIERRVFRELALGSGAAKAVVWYGALLDNDEVQNLLDKR